MGSYTDCEHIHICIHTIRSNCEKTCELNIQIYSSHISDIMSSKKKKKMMMAMRMGLVIEEEQAMGSRCRRTNIRPTIYVVQIFKKSFSKSSSPPSTLPHTFLSFDQWPEKIQRNWRHQKIINKSKSNKTSWSRHLYDNENYCGGYNAKPMDLGFGMGDKKRWNRIEVRRCW